MQTAATCRRVELTGINVKALHMNTAETFEIRLARLDVSLVSAIPTQSTIEDRLGWLAVQRAIRGNGYTYLETGSYLGGSIQQHLLDPLCKHIISIDKRPAAQPDERDEVISYTGSSTEIMLNNLRKIDAAATSKVITFESDAADVNPASIPDAPIFCFIDGEHTRAAVMADFEFCLKVCHADAAICLHDARIIHLGIDDILKSLKQRNIPFTARRLGGDTFGIFLRNSPAARDAYIGQNSRNAEQFLRKMRYRSMFKAALPKWVHASARWLFPAP
jgi:hypothetical protein